VFVCWRRTTNHRMLCEHGLRANTKSGFMASSDFFSKTFKFRSVVQPPEIRSGLDLSETDSERRALLSAPRCKLVSLAADNINQHLAPGGMQPESHLSSVRNMMNISTDKVAPFVDGLCGSELCSSLFIPVSNMLLLPLWVAVLRMSWHEIPRNMTQKVFWTHL
jgi:hypothetical protein